MIKLQSLLHLCSLLIFASVTNAAYTACDDCTDRANTSALAEIELRLYSSDDSEIWASVTIGDAEALVSEIDSSKPTVLYVSGWTENPDSTSVQTVLAAYLSRQDHNVLIANYSEIADTEWEYAAASAEGVGYTLATGLNDMVAEGLDSTTLHVVGHSLGGQVSGFIGKYVNFTLPRITGLDPAGPNFDESDDHLEATDAVFVDVIHTNPGYLGIAYATGTVDFYPNGNSLPQPGCEDDSLILAASCSHYRSWIYYAESLIDEDAFVGIACASDTEFQSGSCSSEETVVMGYATPTSVNGTFDLQTNSVSPYGRDYDGTAYVVSS